MYTEDLMDHYHHSSFRGSVKSPDFNSGAYNPSCGDNISFQGKIRDFKVVDLKFDGKGCVISQAAASMLSKHCLNKSVSEVLALDTLTIKSLIGINLGPTRLRCALLSLEAIQQGLGSYK